MGEYWADRTGRWRRVLHDQRAPTLEDRLYEVIHNDIQAGSLPAGALLPSSQRVASELAIMPASVDAAYSRLVAEGHLDALGDGLFCIACHGAVAHVGSVTQIRFEAALLHAVREAAARGLSCHEATGIFKAAMQRMSNANHRHDDDPPLVASTEG